MTKFFACLSLLIFIGDPARCHADSAKVNIGVLVPLTGDTAVGYGEPVRAGVALAQSQTPDSPLALTYEDSQCSIKEAIAGAKKLIDTQSVKAIIGDVCWTDALATITEPAHVVVVSTGSAQSAVREAGDYVFRLKVDVAVDSRELARRLRDVVKAKSAATISVQDNWGDGIRANFVDEFQKAGGIITDQATVIPTERDFRSSLVRLGAKKPDVLVIAAYPHLTGIILKEAEQLKVGSLKAAYRGGIGDETYSLAGSAAEGLIYVEEFDATAADPNRRQFVSAFSRKYGKSPNLFAAMGYDAFMLLDRAVRACADNTACIRDYLYRVKNYQAVSGTLSFDSHGDVEKTLSLKHVVNGQAVDLR